MRYIFILTIVCAMNACAQKKNISKNALQHYAIADAKELVMPKELTEISGIAIGNKDSILYAEQDELGNIYAINPNTLDVRLHISTGLKGDFEDICLHNNLFYLLRSDGRILSLPDASTIKKGTYKILKHDAPRAEYEGLCYHPNSNSLYLLAKTIPNNKENIFIYQLQLDKLGNCIGSQLIQLNVKDWNYMLPKKNMHFKPSAISFNIIDNRWYILSSVNHMILVLDEKWQLQDFAELNTDQYPQPEGMAFDAKGNLWIASEARTQKSGKIYKIERR